MYSDLIKSVLLLVVAFGVRWFFTLINVALDDATFGSIVAGIVALLLAQFGHAIVASKNPNLVERGLLKE